jgi:hypothetical protein
MGRRLQRRLSLSVVIWIACFGSIGTAAFGAEDHVFNATLSLTGGCNETALDNVPDPSCPATPPASPFASPVSVKADSHGDIYVLTMRETEAAKGGHIDIFDPTGHFISEMFIPVEIKNLAVDSQGNLYVFSYDGSAQAKVVLYEPTVYEPSSMEIEYGEPSGTVVEGASLGSWESIAVNPVNDHLFINNNSGEFQIREYSSAESGNVELGEFAACSGNCNQSGLGLAIDAAHNRIYHVFNDPGKGAVVRVFELDPPHDLLDTINGSVRPSSQEFPFRISISADEGTGHLFVYPESPQNSVYEFAEDGSYLATISHSLGYVVGAEITIDNGAQSPNGALNPRGRYLFVPSNPLKEGHMFAFGPPELACAPKVESTSVRNVTENEAELLASVNPCNRGTEYLFEYTTQQRFETEGFTGAAIAREGTIPAGEAGVAVSAPLGGLNPGTAYRFRLVATNEKGSDQAERGLSTYPGNPLAPCPNDPLRSGLSAGLPDCRAYELVTPPETNARNPVGVQLAGIHFAGRQASPSGNALSFVIEGGGIVEGAGAGGLWGDPYLATRASNGWIISPTGPTGLESASPEPGSTSPDQGYSFWTAAGEGAAVSGNKATNYIRYPDGHSDLIGRGSMGEDPAALGKWISDGGSHLLFTSGVPLEEGAPPAGTTAIYDRTADGATYVISLLPEEITPSEGEDAFFGGASPDGRGVLFEIGNTLYLRDNDAQTYEVAQEAVPAGVADGGHRAFYVKGGDLYGFERGAVIPFTSSGDVRVVNVASAGTAAYFVSPSVLTSALNPNGASPEPGKENLYLSREGAISFVGVLTEDDVEEEVGASDRRGLGTWTDAFRAGSLGNDPSRTTPDGSAIVFESEADLTGVDSVGHTEVYRYDSSAGSLFCLSCPPTGAPATGVASLESISKQALGAEQPFSHYEVVPNLRPDGRRVVFQSTVALVPTDTDQLQDVYEWEEQGVGSCARAGGCVYPISSGHSARNDYLFGVSDSGDDVFFRTADLLLPADREETPSIYDARVGGGFAESKEEECRSEVCRPRIASGSSLGTPAKPVLGVDGQVGRRKRCSKGKRAVKRHGTVHCVKRHHRKQHRRRAGSKGKVAGR